MTIWILVKDNTIVDKTRVPPSSIYNKEYAKGFVENEDDTLEVGYTLVNNEWTKPPEPVPSYVFMSQARLALLAAGYYNTINTAIANMPGIEGEAARIKWEYAATVQRSDPLVLAMGQILGLDDIALDNLFIEANKI